jgi:Large eukaryotic DNA virus major capsid protein/Major capsid protein N-terminus
MQLVAYGAQDVYLTGNPKVTFFQAVYKRHTNFAMELIQQTTNGSPSSSGRVSVTIARNGDLVGNMHVALTPTANVTTSNNSAFDVNWVAERAIAAVELTIGGQRIDKHYQTWWRLYSEVFLAESDKYSWAKMTTMSNPSGGSGSGAASPSKVYLPLLFFFNRNPGLYLPLIALQYHEVRLDFDLTTYYASYFGTTNAFEVWANYVYLDTEERRRFAQKGHEYLIEQVQHTGGDQLTSSSSSENSIQLVRLSFNHPVKELIWCYINPNGSATANLNALWNFCTSTNNVNVTSNVQLIAASNNYVLPNTTGVPMLLNMNGLSSINLGFTNPNVGNCFWVEEGNLITSPLNGVEVGPLHQFKVILNGQDRFKEQLGKYFNQVQPFYHHTGTPYPGVYVYSFALQPEEHQPTGTCNFSRIDNAQVSVQLKSNSQATLQKLFAVNYNILRIQSGMGGLAFSN